MKKIVLLLIAVVSFVFTGCEGNNPKLDTGTLVIVNGFSGSSNISVFEIVNGVENTNPIIKTTLGAKDSYESDVKVGDYRVFCTCGLYYDEKNVTITKNSKITVTLRK